MVTKTDTLGMVRVRFGIRQRDSVLRELRMHKDGHLEALNEIYPRHPDKYDEDTVRQTREKLEIVEQALNYAEGTEPGRPFDLVVPIWFAQSLVDNGARIAVEDLAGTLDALWTGRLPNGRSVPDSRAALRRALKDARIWIKSLLSAYEYPHQPR